MARYTIREFTDAVGLGKDRDGVTRSGIILKALVGLGIAKEAGRKHGSNGRPAVLYEVPDTIVIPVGAPQTVATPAPAEVASAAPMAVAAAPQGFCYDDDDED